MNETASKRLLSGVCVCLIALYASWVLELAVWVAPSLALILMVACSFALLNEVAARQWVMVVLIVALGVIALGSPSPEWDARSIWLFHAKRIYFDRDMLSQLDGYAAWSHNDYPVLVPVVGASLAALAGGWNEVFPKVAGVLVMVPALLVLRRNLPSINSQVAFAILLIFFSGNLLANGYMDALLAIYFAAAFALALDLFEARTEAKPQPRPPPVDRVLEIVTTISIFSGLTLLKTEGVFALGTVLAGVVLIQVVRRHRIEWRSVAICGASMLLLLHWKLIVTSHGITNDLGDSNLLEQLLSRLPHLANFEIIVRALFLNWQMLAVLLVFVAGGWKSGWGRLWQAALVAAGLYAAILFAVYLSTPSDLAWHLSTSANRTILPVFTLLGFAGLASLGAQSSKRPAIVS